MHLASQVRYSNGSTTNAGINRKLGYCLRGIVNYANGWWLYGGDAGLVDEC